MTNWSSGTTYSSGEVVYCPVSGACSTNGQGSSWVSLVNNNIGHDPYNTKGTDWQEIAAAGANGTNGTNARAGSDGRDGGNRAGGLERNRQQPIHNSVLRIRA